MSAAPQPLPLLLTMGDAAGIGPEILLKAWQAHHTEPEFRALVAVADLAVLRRAGALLAPDGMPPMLALIDHPAQWTQVPPDCLPVLQPSGLGDGLQNHLNVPLHQVAWGQVHAACGAAAACCIEAAVAWVQQGAAAGLVTAPLNKAALAAAGVPYPGHTEMLQALATPSGGTPPPVRMMLANDELRVVLVTIHLSLRRAIEALSFDAVLQSLRISHQAAQAWPLPQPGAPRIAVAALNPHAGEGGLFGDEELRIIAPAIAAARAEGIDAQGPFPPDTVFMRARNAPGHPGAFDLVLAMTHDHGLIPVKYLGVEHGVNLTLGLPFVRSSPDHGTAFDIAGQGVADPASFIAAVRTARRLAGLPQGAG